MDQSHKGYLQCMSQLVDRVCLMLEHMSEESDYMEATKYMKGLAKQLGIKI